MTIKLYFLLLQLPVKHCTEIFLFFCYDSKTTIHQWCAIFFPYVHERYKNRIHQIRLSNIEWRTRVCPTGIRLFRNMKNRIYTIPQSRPTPGLVKIHKYNGYKLSICLPGVWLNEGYSTHSLCVDPQRTSTVKMRPTVIK